MKNFKVIHSDIIFRGKVFDIQVDKIKYDSGGEAPREVVLHNGGAVVAAVTPENKIILVKQYRYPFDEELYELPAGKLEIGEDPRICAERELAEETGCTAGKIIELGTIATSPGFTNELLHIFLAEDLSSGMPDREEGEAGMQIFELELSEIVEMILSGEIKDSKTIAGIFYFMNRKF